MTFLTDDTERQLYDWLHDGDHAAMQAFYARYGGRMMGCALRYVGNEDDAKDVLQESLIKIFSRIGDFTYRGRGSLEAWAMRLVANQSLSLLRERKRRGDIDWDRGVPDVADEGEPDVADVPPEVVQHLIEQLPDGYRAVFTLYVVEQLSHEEIARRLGIKRDSSASQLHRAKALLARQITQYRQQKQTEQ